MIGLLLDQVPLKCCDHSLSNLFVHRISVQFLQCECAHFLHVHLNVSVSGA